jgi:hypothetical protein
MEGLTPYSKKEVSSISLPQLSTLFHINRTALRILSNLTNHIHRPRGSLCHGSTSSQIDPSPINRISEHIPYRCTTSHLAFLVDGMLYIINFFSTVSWLGPNQMNALRACSDFSCCSSPCGDSCINSNPPHENADITVTKSSGMMSLFLPSIFAMNLSMIVSSNTPKEVEN